MRATRRSEAEWSSAARQPPAMTRRPSKAAVPFGRCKDTPRELEAPRRSFTGEFITGGELGRAKKMGRNFGRLSMGWFRGRGIEGVPLARDAAVSPLPGGRRRWWPLPAAGGSRQASAPADTLLQLGCKGIEHPMTAGRGWQGLEPANPRLADGGRDHYELLQVPAPAPLSLCTLAPPPP